MGDGKLFFGYGWCMSYVQEKSCNQFFAVNLAVARHYFFPLHDFNEF